MPPCTGRLRPPPSPALLLPGRLTAAAENPRSECHPLRRTAGCTANLFVEPLFSSQSHSDNGPSHVQPLLKQLFPGPRPQKYAFLRTYVPTYIHTYEFYSCSLGAILRPGESRERRRRRNHGHRGRTDTRFTRFRKQGKKAIQQKEARYDGAGTLRTAFTELTSEERAAIYEDTAKPS